MTIHPFWFWLWMYFTIGLVTVLITSTEETWWYTAEDEKQSNRLARIGWSVFDVCLWPLIVLVLTVEACVRQRAKFKELRARKADLQELQRLRDESARLQEEVESLKDKLYELEP